MPVTSAHFLDSGSPSSPLDIFIGDDPGSGATRWSIQWGDGSSETAFAQVDGSFFAFHAYATAASAVYDIRVHARAPGATYEAVHLHVFDDLNLTSGVARTGSGGQDYMAAGSGNDSFQGGGSNDWFFGNGGDDFADGGTGDDVLSGDAGNDSLSGGKGDDRVSGGTGDDLLDGGDGNDTVVGGQGNDVIYGGKGDDVLGETFLNGEDPESGDDTIYGGDGNDTLNGLGGADRLKGGDGADAITGGTGADVMTGGAGPDQFIFQAYDSQLTVAGDYDRISDFERTEDVIALDVGSGTYDSFENLTITYNGRVATVEYSPYEDFLKVVIRPGEFLTAVNFDFFDFPA